MKAPPPAALERLLREHDINVPTLVKRAGASRDSLYRWLRGQGASEDTVVAVADALGVSPAYVRYGHQGVNAERLRECLDWAAEAFGDRLGHACLAVVATKLYEYVQADRENLQDMLDMLTAEVEASASGRKRAKPSPTKKRKSRAKAAA